MTDKMLKLVFLSLVILGFSASAVAAIPNVQIQCNTVSKTQNELRVQLETGYVYDSLQIKTQNARQSVKLTESELQNTSVQLTFASPVKSVTLTYQDPETSSVVVFAEDVVCSKADLSVAPKASPRVVESNYDMQMKDTDLMLANLTALTETQTANANANAVEEVIAPSVEETPVQTPEVTPLAAENANSQPAVVTPIEPSVLADSEILPTDEPETSAQILGIETSSKPNPKHRMGAQMSKKKAAHKPEEDFDFSEDIEDF